MVRCTFTVIAIEAYAPTKSGESAETAPVINVPEAVTLAHTFVNSEKAVTLFRYPCQGKQMENLEYLIQKSSKNKLNFHI